MLLNAMGLQSGMVLLKPFVAEKYHQLIKEDNINNNQLRPRVPNTKVSSNNFNKNITKQTVKPVLPEETRDDNVTSDETKNNRVSPNLAVNRNQGANVQQKDSTKAWSDCVASNAGGTPQISYQELEIATDNWNSQKILGHGGFGTVFRGR